MTERFLCISCWQEFLVNPAEREARSGKVVCPHCGYIMPAGGSVLSQTTPSSAVEPSGIPVQTIPHFSSPKFPPGHKSRLVPPPTPASELTGTGEITATGTMPDTDGTPEMGEETTSEIVGEEDDEILGPFTDEPTPVQEPPGMDVFDPSSLDADADQPSETLRDMPLQLVWHLRTGANNLKLKFNDMESLLAWRQKVGGSSQAEVSPDGTRWVDMRTFVDHFERTSDSWKAFVLAANLDESEPPPATLSSGSFSVRPNSGSSIPVGPGSGMQPLPGRNQNSGLSPVPKDPGSLSPIPKTTAPNQFTFQVTQQPKTPVVKYVVLGVLGLAAIGAAIALLIWSSGS